MKDTSRYHSPFDGRYTSAEMNKIFSDDSKFSTWRRLWVALAKAEKALGLPITDGQIAEMERYVTDINYDVANAREKEVRHDVMAHVYAYGQQALTAKGIIHLGATSCYVTDNTDILLMDAALKLVRSKLLGVIELLADFADDYKKMPTLGYTHYQPATPTTVGKRATLWIQNFVENLKELDFVANNLKMLGCRGATGSSETFMKLFDGDEEKCKQLERLIAEEFGFVPGEVCNVGGDCDVHGNDGMFGNDDMRSNDGARGNDAAWSEVIYPVSGQTYPRNLDLQVINALAAIGASAYKMAQDIRLLQHDKEIEEPFAESQIGSSAMAYKRNPMRCERIDALARQLATYPAAAWQTAATQYLERTLDDSACRRIYIPDAFRAADAILILCTNVVDGIVVNEGVIRARLDKELPFMATEAIIMRAVERGADRQEMHERIREHSLELARMVKEEGLEGEKVKSTMVDFIVGDVKIPLEEAEIYQMLNASNLIGRCAGQVDDYLKWVVDPLLEMESANVMMDSAVEV